MPTPDVDARPTGTITPSGELRTFAEHEVIVSKTDTTGRITYVNDVFLRVSRFSEDEVTGRPHKIVRHPDMPRVVFWLLWHEIAAGREIFAYVKNLAADGAAYWVFAHVTPTWKDDQIVGYHSNRRSPDARAVHAVEPVYRSLCAAEAGYSRPSQAIDAPREVLNELLERAGMSYDQWVWSLAGDRSARRGTAA